MKCIISSSFLTKRCSFIFLSNIQLSKNCLFTLSTNFNLFKNPSSNGDFGYNLRSILYQHSNHRFNNRMLNCYEPQRRLQVKIASEPNNIYSLLDEIFKLKDTKVPSIVVENNLRSLYFHYTLLKKDGKEEFLKELATKYFINHDNVIKVSKQLTELEPNSGLLLKGEEKLRNLLTPQYAWLFTHLSRLDRGVKFLVDLRCDILGLLMSIDAKSPYQLALQQLNITLRELLGLWFSVGFLNLERVTWSSPCSLLQKISEYEAVHPVRSWTDIMQRVGPYRRCFVYTHNSMPGEPLVILHVALTKDISDSTKNIIQKQQKLNNETQSVVLEEEESRDVKAFIFYSISSTQKGLQGIDLGNYLIKRAAKELHAEYPHVTMFSSLSPIPAFRQWLLEKMKAAEKSLDVFPTQEWDELLKSINPDDQIDAWAKLRSMILDSSWFHDDNLVKALKSPLMTSCSRYLYLEKRRGYAFDSVANFHLRNGAVMWRLNWLADVSPRGLTNSCGLMINYRYYLDAADSYSLKYIQERKITASDQIVKLATGSPI